MNEIVHNVGDFFTEEKPAAVALLAAFKAIEDGEKDAAAHCLRQAADHLQGEE